MKSTDMQIPYPTIIKQSGQLAKHRRPGKGTHLRHLPEDDGVCTEALDAFKRTYAKGLHAAPFMPRKDEQDYLTGRTRGR